MFLHASTLSYVGDVLPVLNLPRRRQHAFLQGLSALQNHHHRSLRLFASRVLCPRETADYDVGPEVRFLDRTVQPKPGTNPRPQFLLHYNYHEWIRDGTTPFGFN